MFKRKEKEMFAKTPAQKLGKKEPIAKDLINKMSSKWTNRTKSGLIKWPVEGSFDLGLCDR